MASIFNPLKPDSQSSQPDTQGCSASDSTLGAEGPRMPLHYSKAPAMIPPFDLAWVGILPKMSPITDQENELLNFTLGSPITHTTPQQVKVQLVLRKCHVVRVSSWDGESCTCLESMHPPGYGRDLQQQKRATCTQS